MCLVNVNSLKKTVSQQFNPDFIKLTSCLNCELLRLRPVGENLPLSWLLVSHDGGSGCWWAHGSGPRVWVPVRPSGGRCCCGLTGGCWGSFLGVSGDAAAASALLSSSAAPASALFRPVPGYCSPRCRWWLRHRLQEFRPTSRGGDENIKQAVELLLTRSCFGQQRHQLTVSFVANFGCRFVNTQIALKKINKINYVLSCFQKLPVEFWWVFNSYGS